jgi:hypothetical protein
LRPGPLGRNEENCYGFQPALFGSELVALNAWLILLAAHMLNVWFVMIGAVLVPIQTHLCKNRYNVVTAKQVGLVEVSKMLTAMALLFAYFQGSGLEPALARR